MKVDLSDQILTFILDHVNYVGEDDKFGAMAISYKREKTEIPLNNEEDVTISQYEYRVIVRTSEVRVLAIIVDFKSLFNGYARFPSSLRTCQ